jgi:hypothetical protein
MSPAQDWCLNCGAAVTTHIASPPSWRGPLVAMLGVLLLAVAAIALAFFALADDDPPPDARATATPPPGLVTPTPSAEPGETPAPTATPDDEPASWPAGESAWTIVLSSTSSRAAAVRRAERFEDRGIPVGVLSSDDFSPLPRGSWVVFSGQYDSARAAARAQRSLAAAPSTAYVRRISPR